jgi:hypothetical protein
MKLHRLRCLHRVLTLIALHTCFSASAALAQEWKPLFNGKNLDGWTQHGGKAPYVVEEGVIVGTAVTDTPNSFLCTTRDYANFILELEVKIDPALNSGIQFRSHVYDTVTTPKNRDGSTIVTERGELHTIAAGRVHGYQYELDFDTQRARFWTAGVYEEGRRLWLFPGRNGGDPAAFTKAGAIVSKPGDWNLIRIEANGTHLRTWLNGQLRADLHDDFDTSGFIGLQVHSIPNNKPELKGLQARFRNIRIMELPATPPAPASHALNTLTDDEKKAGWRLLWDGQTSAGWRGARLATFPDKGWEMKDGVLTVPDTGGAESRAAGDIITTEKFAAFELILDFKITPGANSGIKYYVDPELNKGAGSAIGLEFQILDDALHPDAKLGRDGNRTIGSLYDLIPAANKKVNPVGEWNTARIVSTGRHVEHWLNGVKVLEFERASPAFREAVKASKYTIWPSFGELPSGHILLQDHGNQVSFRNIKLRPLPVAE